MYINEVISYMDAWGKLQVEHSNLLDDITHVLENLEEKVFHIYLDADLDNKWTFPPLSNFLSKETEEELINLDWQKVSHSFASQDRLIKNLGVSKDQCFIRSAIGSSSATVIMSWIFSEIAYVAKVKKISIPILLIYSMSSRQIIDAVNQNSINIISKDSKTYSLNSIKEKLNRISPLKFEHPFLIFGVGLDKRELEVEEILHEKINDNDLNVKIDRSITFEPEYYQAGLSILNYFGTVLRDRYPEQNATIKIEQHDLTVRMIIQSEDGNIETIEKALYEYELVLKGQTSADEFAISPLKALELKNQLNLFKFQVESQKEIIALQNGQILSLKDIVDKALSPISHAPVTIINQLHNLQSTVINYKAEISKSNDDLEELIDLADSDVLKNKLATIQNALDNNRNLDNPEDVKDSNGMKKLTKFLNEANEVGTEASELAEKGGKALDLLKSLGRRYNSIAEWCGMPVIPSLFVKE